MVMGFVVVHVFPVHRPTSHYIQPQLNLGINSGDERRDIKNENGVLRFGIELAGCLMRERRRENKGRT